MALRLHDLLSFCWSIKKIPQDFKDAMITTLYKNKGDRGDCNNYHDISLLSVTAKLLDCLLLTRLQRLAKTSTQNRKAASMLPGQ